MKYIKKIMTFILVVGILFQNFMIFASSKGTETHWAKEEMDYLFRKGVIEGDQNGFRPDSPILRAEFVKIINLNFGFVKESDIYFSDVSSEKWYFSHMKRAKEAGYLMGDNEGLVHPEDVLTRAEASVIYARILKISDETNQTLFSDKNEIPNWAISAISALVKNKIIAGYGDGTFKPNATITRAEAFSTLVRCENYLATKISTPAEDNSPVIIQTLSGGGGGGGGGSKGGNQKDKILEIPSVQSIHTGTFDISWEPVENATRYELIVKRTTKALPTTTSIIAKKESINIEEIVASLVAGERLRLETFTLKIKSVGGNGYQDSYYSEEIPFYYTNDTVKIPDDIRYIQSIEGDTEQIILTWSKAQHVSTYKLFVNFEGDQFIPLEVVENQAVIPNEYIKNLKEKHKIKFQSLSSNPEILDSEILEREVEFPLFGGKDGTYNLIYNQRHFENIKKYPQGKYSLKKNLVLENYEPFSFGGELIGVDNKALKSIKVQLVKSTSTMADPLGLFTFLTGSARLENLKLEGSITGQSYVGGFAGIAGSATEKITTGATIVNCINEANITALAAVAGGFVARAYTDAGGQNLVLTQLINRGTIAGEETVGGIVGITAAVISNCANYGNISGTRNVAGGIAGSLYGNITTSYNAGKITGVQGVGGIIGVNYGASSVISDCFNVGKINATNGVSFNNIGGICGSTNTSSKRILTIKNSYQLGTVLDGSFIYPNYNKTADILITAEKCYYITDVEEDDQKEETNFIKDSSDIKLSQFEGFSDDIWHMDKKNGYGYPQFKTFPFIVEPRELSIPEVEKIEYDGMNLNMFIKGESKTHQYEVKVYKEDVLIANLLSAGGSNSVIDLSEVLNSFVEYRFEIRALSNVEYLFDSKERSYAYLHRPFFIPTPILSSEFRIENDTEEQYLISWEKFDNPALSHYEVSIYEEDGITLCKEPFIQEESTFVLPQDCELGKKYQIKVQGISQIEEQNSDVAELLIDTRFAGGNGNSQPYQIAIGRHFENIALEPSASYYIIKNISLSASYQPFDFTGKLIGDDENNLKTINLNLASETTGPFGLFLKITGSGEIKNIKLTGSILAQNATNVGGFAGVATSATGKIENCINEANITGKVGVGGFVGRAYDGVVSFKLNKVSNRGNITGVAEGRWIGGIVGVSMVNASNFTYASNSGNITGVTIVGGLIGGAYHGITNSYNIGTVYASGEGAGGIMGTFQATNSPNVINCFNTGNISTGVSGNYVGGILGAVQNVASRQLKLYRCYNTGVITAAGTVNNTPITANPNYTPTVEYCYYLSATSEDDGVNNTTPLKEDEMTNIANFETFTEANGWRMIEGYPYPFIKDHKMIDEH